MFAITEPFQRGCIPVSDLHKVYYEVSGNPQGEPALYIHGGPGSGCSESSRGWFDPSRYMIVLIDQRGCGKSTPNAELIENTTQNLVADIETIRNHLEITHWSVIFGGSWGSFLGLAYLDKIIPHVRVDRIVLYGIFLGRRSEVLAMYGGSGPAASLYPDAYQDFIQPLDEKGLLSSNADPNISTVELYRDIFVNSDHIYDEEFVSNAVFRWSQWESRIVSVTNDISKWDEIDQSLKTDPNYLRSHSRLENHYFVNNCWLDGEYFLSKPFIDKLAQSKLNLSIVTGRYDLVCPPCTAYQLYNHLKQGNVDCKIYLVPNAGHTARDSSSTILSLINP